MNPITHLELESRRAALAKMPALPASKTSLHVRDIGAE